MLNFFLISLKLGPGSSPDPNIYYRTDFSHQYAGMFMVQVPSVWGVPSYLYISVRFVLN